MDTKKLRQKILDLAIRGKLVPQDPNDEPASVLLERIRAEKERLIKEGKIKRSKKTASDTNENGIPNGWVCCRFDEICSRFSTGPFGSMVHKSDYVSQKGIPIVNPLNIVDGKIVTNNLMMVSNEKAQELDRYRLTKDDILIARRGDLRKCCIVSEESIDWLCGTGSFFLHIPFVEPRYIELFYLSEYVQTILKRECVGATMDNLNQSVLGSIPLSLPPLKEQERIVNEVNHWFAMIDELESNEDDLLKAIDKAKSIILDLAIHGKLVPQDPNDEPAIELLKRINPKFEPCDVEDCPYAIPSSWEWTTIGMSSKYKSASIDPSKYKDQDFELYSVPSFETGMPEAVKGSLISSSKKIVKEGDVLVCKINPHLNRIWIVEHHNKDLQCIASSEWIIFRNRDIDSQYLMRCFSSSYFLHLMLSNVSGVGGSLMRAQPASVEKYLFPLPPLAEQKRIVAKIEEVFKALDALS